MCSQAKFDKNSHEENLVKAKHINLCLGDSYQAVSNLDQNHKVSTEEKAWRRKMNLIPLE